MLSRLLRPRSQKIAAILLFALFAAALTAAFVKFPQGAPLPPFLILSGKFHPLILHLPIGMLVGAVLLECVTGPLRRHDAAVTLLLWLGFVTSMKAVLAGYFLAQPGGYPQDVLQWHLWSGISVPVLTFITLLAKLHHQQKAPLMSSSLYRVPLFTTAAALFVAGHFGGTMSHGDILKDIRTFVKQPVAASPVTVGSPLTDLVIYDAVIAPMMESKCVSCHGLEKQKGELQLHTHEAMIKAGESEKLAIIPGKSAQSESVLRILLPASHDDHMPPENKPQITPAELEVLQWWVDAGASPDLKVGDASVPDNVREKISALLAAPAITAGAQGEAGAAGPAGAPAAAPDMAPVQALEKELGVAILPLAQNDPALSFNCVNVADKFGDAELAKFAPVADRMSEVNLGRSKVTDAGLASLAGMKNLKKLHLPNTAVTDAGIDSLLVLTNLEYLNLFNTKITDAGLAKLEKLPNLKRLFVWQTGATKPAAEALHAKLPGLVINWKPPQRQGKSHHQQRSRHKGRQRNRQQRPCHGQPVRPAIFPRRRQRSHRDATRRREDKCHAAQGKTHGQTLPQNLRHREILRFHGLPEIPPQGIPPPAGHLPTERAVQLILHLLGQDLVGRQIPLKGKWPAGRGAEEHKSQRQHHRQHRQQAEETRN